MVIELYGQKFEVYGFPFIENGYKYAYSSDNQGNAYVLMWAIGKEPVQGNVIVTRINSGLK